MKRQQAEAVLDRFFEECGEAAPARQHIEPVLDRVWERLEWRADEFVSTRVPVVAPRSLRLAWVAGIALIAAFVTALIWRQGPPLPVTAEIANSNEQTLARPSSQQAGDGLQLTVPQDVFELASVKLLAPDSEAARTANQFSDLQLMATGCTGGNLGGVRVDPGRLTMPAVTVETLVIAAYGQDCSLVRGGPAWIRVGEYYQISALLPTGTPSYTIQDLTKSNAPVLQRMLQNLLADRFRLIVKRELVEQPVYALSVATPGKMKLSPDETVPAPVLSPLPFVGMMRPQPPLGRGQSVYFVLPGEVQMSGHAISAAELAKILRPRAGRVVVDKTGFTGLFDYNLKFDLDTVPSQPATAPRSDQAIPPVPGAPLPLPSLEGALQDHLGLKLESTRMPIEVLIIQSVERPAEN